MEGIPWSSLHTIILHCWVLPFQLQLALPLPSVASSRVGTCIQLYYVQLPLAVIDDCLLTVFTTQLMLESTNLWSILHEALSPSTIIIGEESGLALEISFDGLFSVTVQPV